jgi:hypothetical protein
MMYERENKGCGTLWPRHLDFKNIFRRKKNEFMEIQIFHHVRKSSSSVKTQAKGEKEEEEEEEEGQVGRFKKKGVGM